LHHALLPFGVTLLATTATAVATATVATAFAATTTALVLLLTFGRCGHVSCRWHGVGLGVVGFGHGESRDQN
jgi:hypothetical protein